MVVKWNWDEFDAEHSIVLTSTADTPPRYSNYNLIQFFAKYGKFTSFVRLNASKCIAIAKYVLKSEAADAIKNDSMQFYGLKMKRIVECPQYSQFDTSMYSYMNSSEITKILQGFSSDPEDELVSPIADVEQEQLIEQGHDLCAFCGGYCLPNDCLTEAWIERHSKTEEAMVDDSHAVDHKTSEFSILNKSKVYMTHVASGNTVYIRSADKRDNRAYINLIRDVADYCTHPTPLISVPEPGDVIAALFESIYYRCRVVYVFTHTEEVLVDFIDFGNVEKVHLSNACILAPEFQAMEPTAKMITLKGITNKNEKAKRYLKSLVIKLKRLVLLYENDLSECELIDDNTGQSITAYLRNGKTVPKSLRAEDKMRTELMRPNSTKDQKTSKNQRPQLKNIEYIVESDRNVSVLTISNSLVILGYIHVILRSDMKLFKANDELVNKIGKEMESHPPYVATVPDELCLVKLYNEYYRAVLIDSKYKGRDRYEFVDYGYILPVKTENVRRLPDNLLFPCITLKCFLDVLPPVNQKRSRITEEESKILQSHLPPYEMLIFQRIKAKKWDNFCIGTLQRQN